MKELNEHIKSGNFARAYLFYGTEAFLAKKWQEALTQAIVPPGGEMNVELFEGKVSPSNIIEAAETLPFFADYRLTIIKDSGLFAAGRSDDSAIMAEFIKNIPYTTILVFSENDADKRGRLYKRINENGLVCEAKTPKEAELAEWASKLAAKLGVTMPKSVAMHLVRNGTADMQSLYNEVEKLVAYKPGNNITTDDIDLLCAKSLEAKIFDLMRAISNKDIGMSTALYTNLIAMKESPLMILAMIARQFRFCLQCSDLAKNTNQKEIAARLSLHPFAVREFIDVARNFSTPNMIFALEECLQTDYAVKSGQIGDVPGVEMLIAKCCNLC